MSAPLQPGRAWPRPQLGLVIGDALMWALGLSAAAWARWDFRWGPIDPGDLLVAIGVAVGVNLACGLATRLYLGRRRLGSFEEALELALCSVASTFVLVAVIATGPDPHLIPIGAALAGGAYQILAALAIRYLGRAATRPRLPRPGREHRVLVFGAGDAGTAIAKALLVDQQSDLEPVAFLDDDPGKARLRVHGLAVAGGRADIAAAAAELGADTLLIAVPSAPPEARAAVADLGRAAGLAVKILPSARQRVWDGSASVGGIRSFTIADYLGRDEVRIDIERVAAFVTGRRVLVTGAGGFIGAALCETIAGFGPRRLVALDHDENALHALGLRLAGRGGHDAVLADIRDRDAVWEHLAAAAPDVVFHAAAHKHVDVLERFPAEAFKTNVLGTLHVLEAAAGTGAERFVNISTDKAADPISVLGASKRIGEMLTAHFAGVLSQPYISVRFGNVLGSTGSVVPTFQHQIEVGAPLSVTHPEVARYFMTSDEAVRLVMQAAALGDGGDALVLDMGEPVRIVDLARRLVAERRPGSEPEVVFTGLRPGEKLVETLVATADELVDHPHQRVARYRVPPLDPAELAGLDGTGDAEALARRMLHLAGGTRLDTPHRRA